MDSNDLEACGRKCCYFWFHSEVKFLTRFDVFLDLVIFAYFNAFFFFRFLCSKELYLHLFCIISMFYMGKCLYQRFEYLKNFNELRSAWRSQQTFLFLFCFFFFFIILFYFSLQPPACCDFSIISQPISMKFGMLIVLDETNRLNIFFKSVGPGVGIGRGPKVYYAL